LKIVFFLATYTESVSGSYLPQFCHNSAIF